VVLGEAHLRHIVHEYLDYFNTQRPHQAMDKGHPRRNHPMHPAHDVRGVDHEATRPSGGAAWAVRYGVLVFLLDNS